jgi:hypothetical protein
MKEDELLRQVLDLCRKYQLPVYHAYDSRKTTGPGFPDLVIVGNDVIFAELKSNHGQLSWQQTSWKYHLRAAEARWFLWTPKDLESGGIEKTLNELGEKS